MNYESKFTVFYIIAIYACGFLSGILIGLIFAM
ncbi:hypothetical protein [Erwinia phage Gungnir39]|nr:hypothetical protein [Erwinia phage Gungnir39]